MTDSVIERPAFPANREAPASPRRAARPGLVLALVLTAQFMAVLDMTIVNVAVPTIHTSLNASGSALQLIVAGYTIAYAVLLVTGARIGDIVGPGRLFRYGLVGFTAMSLACGLAPSAGLLIIFLVLRGISAAAMMPQVLSLIQRVYPGPERAKAMSLYTAILSAGTVFGQVVGGLLISANVFGWSWRPTFLINVPIGLALLVVGLRALPERGAASRKLDVPGVALLTPAVLSFVVPLVLGHEQHWPVWGWMLLAAGPVLFAAFLLVEHRVTLAGGSPIAPRRLLALPGMGLSVAIMALGMICYTGFLFTTAVHLQSGLGFSALHTGLVFAPGAVMFGIASYCRRRIPMTHVRSVSVAGYVVAAAGLVIQAALLSGGGTGGVWMYLTQILFGTAIGLAQAPVMTLAPMKVPVADASDASGLMVTTFQSAGVIGVATVGTVYLTAATSHPAVEAELFTGLTGAAHCQRAHSRCGYGGRRSDLPDRTACPRRVEGRFAVG